MHGDARRPSDGVDEAFDACVPDALDSLPAELRLDLERREVWRTQITGVKRGFESRCSRSYPAFPCAQGAPRSDRANGFDRAQGLRDASA